MYTAKRREFKELVGRSEFPRRVSKIRGFRLLSLVPNPPWLSQRSPYLIGSTNLTWFPVQARDRGAGQRGSFELLGNTEKHLAPFPSPFLCSATTWFTIRDELTVLQARLFAGMNPPPPPRTPWTSQTFTLNRTETRYPRYPSQWPNDLKSEGSREGCFGKVEWKWKKKNVVFIFPLERVDHLGFCGLSPVWYIRVRWSGALNLLVNWFTLAWSRGPETPSGPKSVGCVVPDQS